MVKKERNLQNRLRVFTDCVSEQPQRFRAEPYNAGTRSQRHANASILFLSRYALTTQTQRAVKP